MSAAGADPNAAPPPVALPPVALPPAASPQVAPPLATTRIRLGGRNRGNDEPRFELNMTSMTDVIFILLIFFISLSEIRRSSDIPLDIPEVQDAPALEADEQDPRVIEITKDGRVVLDGAVIAVDELAPALVRVRAESGEEPRIRIRGDKEGHYGIFVQVLSSLSAEKLTKIEIEVQTGS